MDFSAVSSIGARAAHFPLVLGIGMNSTIHLHASRGGTCLIAFVLRMHRDVLGQRAEPLGWVSAHGSVGALAAHLPVSHVTVNGTVIIGAVPALSVGCVGFVALFLRSCLAHSMTSIGEAEISGRHSSSGRSGLLLGSVQCSIILGS